jgi:hypothetical protein
MSISKLIEEAMPRLKQMGRNEIAKAHAMELPGVYMIGARSFGNIQTATSLTMSSTGSDRSPNVATPEQIRAMHEMNEAREELTDGVKEILRVKHIPVMPGWRDRDLDKYITFLDSSTECQASISIRGLKAQLVRSFDDMFRDNTNHILGRGPITNA